MGFLDLTKALSYQSVYCNRTSLCVYSLKGLTTSLSFGQNLARKSNIPK